MTCNAIFSVLLHKVYVLSSYFLLVTDTTMLCWSAGRLGMKEGGLAHITPEAEPPKIDDLES